MDDGLDALDAALSHLASGLTGASLKAACEAAANPILTTARSLVPVGPTSAENERLYGGYEGALRDSLHTEVIASESKVTVKLIAGGKVNGADVYYAHFVEFGTSRMPATPFMRRAFETAKIAALDAFENSLEANLPT